MMISNRISLGRAALLFTAFTFVAGASAPAAAAMGEWVAGEKARVRVIAAGVNSEGLLTAGIEIMLPPGWKTYWRTPGDAGVPPAIDLSGSRNLDAPEVSFPVPHRVDDGYAVTNVYTDRVVLPLSASVPDPSKNVFVVVGVDLGVCDVVCVPDHVDVHAILRPGESDPEASAILAEARLLLPGPPEDGVLSVDGVARDGGPDNHPVFRFDVTVDDPKNAVVFVEGPEDWRAAVPELAGETSSGAAYTVAFNRMVAETPIADARFVVTVVSGDRSVEQAVRLGN